MQNKKQSEMKKAVRLQIRKELSSQQQLKIIKLKGSLISNGFTEIIYIEDYDDEFHINYFDTLIENRNEVHDFINSFTDKEELTDIVTIFK